MQFKLDTSLNFAILISVIGGLWYTAQMIQKLEDDAVTEARIRQLIDTSITEKAAIAHEKVVEDIKNLQKAVDRLTAETALPREKRLLDDWRKGK